MAQLRSTLGGVCILLLAGCSVVDRIVPTSDTPPGIEVMTRGAGGTVPLASCLQTSGPVEIVVGLDDADGLARADVFFDGVLSDSDLIVSPGGDDISISDAGTPREEHVVVQFDGAAGQVRGAATISLAPLAPYTGTLRITVRDLKGATAQAGPFVLASSGGCG